MTYLLIAFIIFVALAPLSHFIPTKAQRHVTRLRERAALDGLFVEFRKLPGSDDRLRPSPPGTIFYGLRHRDRDAPAKRRFFVRGDDYWRELDGPAMAEAPDWLQRLPGAILAAESSRDGIGVYWLEAGEEADVSVIASVLKQRCGQPSSE